MTGTQSNNPDDEKRPALNASDGSDLAQPVAGRPPMESYMQVQKPVVIDDSTVKHYRERCSRLEGELHDCDRKIRLQVDEIMQLKRELSKDRTETLLSHQKEISDLKEAQRNETERLKENHRRDIREFERQISELERQAFKMELENRSGDRTTGNRILDMLEDVAPTLFENITEVLGGALAGQAQPGLTAAGTGPLSQQQADQLRQAFEQELAGSGPEAAPQTNSTAKPVAVPTGGEGPQSPHHPFTGDGLPGGLNDFFAEKRNGHFEQEMKES